MHGPLGTDDAGRDVWTQLVYGARISLLIGFMAGLIAMFIGSTLGILAGYYGGKIDTLLMRTTDVFLVIPDLPLIIVLVAVIRQVNSNIPPLVVLIGVIGLLYWTSTARLIRSQVLSIKERQFVTRARAIGAGNAHIIRKHILPQVLPLIVASTVLIISTSILVEIGPGLSGAGRSHAAVVGHDAQLRFRSQRDVQRRVVVLSAARPGDCVGDAGLRAVGECAGRNVQPATDVASSGRRSTHDRPTERGLIHEDARINARTASW